MFRFKFFFGSICIAMLCVGLFCSSVFSATLVFDGDGKLSGVTGILVDGTSYDVTFVQELASDTFSYSIEAGYSFFAEDATEAYNLTSSLKNILDDALANMDLDYTALSKEDGKPYQIIIMTPYIYEAYDEANEKGRIGKILSSGFYVWYGVVGPNSEYGYRTNEVSDYYVELTAENEHYIYYAEYWAVWTLSEAQTPIPNTIFLLGAGLIGLAGLTREK